MYHRRLNGQVLEFGNTSALYENSLVMFDHQTGSYWVQVSGEAIVGELTGARLDLVASVTMPWGEWKRLYPDTRVLSREQSVGGDYSYLQDVFRNYDAVINAGEITAPLNLDRLDRVDRSLRLADLVLTIVIEGRERVYPLALIGDGAVNDVIGATPVVVFSRSTGPHGAAYLRVHGGRELTFVVAGSGREENFIDEETGSVWNLAGTAIAGPLEGAQLEILPGRRAFWFAVSILLPDADLYVPE